MHICYGYSWDGEAGEDEEGRVQASEFGDILEIRVLF